MRWTEDWTAVSVFTSLLISGPYQLRSSPVSGFFPVLRLDFQTLVDTRKPLLLKSRNPILLTVLIPANLTTSSSYAIFTSDTSPPPTLTILQRSLSPCPQVGALHCTGPSDSRN